MVATERLSRVTGWAEASGQKSALGGRAILQAVTRVKLEQASKVTSWMLTQQVGGEGRADREEYRHAPIRSTGVMSTACKKGGLSHRGYPALVEVAPPTFSIAGWPVRKSERVIRPRKPGNSGGGKDPYFRCAFEEGEER
jgi:hypothetical protein